MERLNFKIMEKIVLNCELESIFFDDTVDNIINDLQTLKIMYKNYDNLRIVEDAAYDGGYYHHIHGERLETDAEAQKRIDYEKMRADELREMRKKQYEALKKELEQ